MERSGEWGGRAVGTTEAGEWGGRAVGASGADNGTAAERDRVRVQFYATYDVMTGVRIAATLGGFFALMVFLIVYKSRSKSVKAMNDPKLVELAEAVVAEEQAEEEERALHAVIEEEMARGSLGGPRFPRSPLPRLPRRPSTRLSLPGTGLPALGLVPLVPLVPLAGTRGTRASPARRWSALSGPPATHRDRRLSSATCSSSGSGYLERRPSSVVCALEKRHTGTSRRLAPLASAGASFAVECELASVGADSVFAEDDTDGEVEQFSTDSGGAEATELTARPRPHPLHPLNSRETLF